MWISPDGATTGAESARATYEQLFADLADGQARALEQLYRVASRRLYGFALWLTGSPE